MEEAACPELVEAACPELVEAACPELVEVACPELVEVACPELVEAASQILKVQITATGPYRYRLEGIVRALFTSE